MPHPKSATDLFLAPVAVEIDQNLQRIRDLNPAEIRTELDLELDRPESPSADRGERQARILQAALRNVNLHEWSAAISDDGLRLRLDGGSVSLDLGLSASIVRYVDGDAG
jgi:hypothetical protein